MTNTTSISLLAALTLSACAHPNQNRYDAADVGKNAVVEFGTIVGERPVEITGASSGLGAVAGMTAGMAAGSAFKNGNGTLAAALAGLVIGGIAGGVAEQAAQDGHGVEYIVTLTTGQTRSVVQNVAEGDKELKVGQPVMVQTSGKYQRVLDATGMPEAIKRPKKIKVVK